MANKKINLLVARAIEDRTLAETPKWNGTPSVVTKVLPYIEFGTKKEFSSKSDDSISGRIFSQGSINMSEKVNNSPSYYFRYKDFEEDLFWLFNWCSSTEEVYWVKSSNEVSTLPSVGDTYSDGTTDYTLKRIEYYRDYSNKQVPQFIFNHEAQIPSGTLTSTDGGDDIVIGSTKLMTEIYYELDPKGRDFREFTSAEKTHLNNNNTTAADLDTIGKTPFMTFGQKFESYDRIIKNAKCVQFGLNMSSGEDGLMTVSQEYKAYDYENKTTGRNSDDWVNNFSGLDKVPKFFQHNFMLGFQWSDLDESVVEGFSEISLESNFGTNDEQDFSSGKHVTNPIMESMAELSLSATKSRHNSLTYLEALQQNTQMMARIVNRDLEGNAVDIFLPKLSVKNAGENEEAVTGEDLEFSIEDADSSLFLDWDESNKLLHNTPIVMRYRVEGSKVNPMLGE